MKPRLTLLSLLYVSLAFFSVNGQTPLQQTSLPSTQSQIKPYQGDGPNRSIEIYTDPKTHATYAEYLYFYFPFTNRPAFRQTDAAHTVIISRVDDAQEFNRWMDNTDIMAICVQYYSPQARASIQLGTLPGEKQALNFQGVVKVLQKFIAVAAQGRALGIKDATKTIYSLTESPTDHYLIVHWDASGKCFFQDDIAFAWQDSVAHFSEADAPALIHAVQESADLYQRVIIQPNQELHEKDGDKEKLLNQIK